MRLKTVFLTEDIPFPISGSARFRKSQLIGLLAEKTDVEVLCFDSRRLTRGSLGIPDDVALTAIERDHEPLWRRAFDSILHPLRPSQFEGLSESMIDSLRARAEPGKILWISGAGVSPYVPVGRKLGYRVIFDDHHPEIQHRLKKAKYMGAFGHLPSLLSSVQDGFYKGRICKQAHAVIEASDLAASQISRLTPNATVHVLRDTVECSAYDEVRGTSGGSLLFFGALDSTGNLRGISWFIDEVLPRLRASLKERLPRVVIAGWNPPRHLIRRLHYEKIELHPNPKSMIPVLADAAVVFFPQRYGESATQQILEAMAAGRPVLSTPKAAEGLLFSPTYDMLVADRADAFTRALINLIENVEFRSGIVSHALETVHKRYDRNRAREELGRLLALLEETPPGATDRQVRQKMQELGRPRH
jgi:glycosyltransferase involved in cell wall biosynthesis